MKNILLVLVLVLLGGKIGYSQAPSLLTFKSTGYIVKNVKGDSFTFGSDTKFILNFYESSLLVIDFDGQTEKYMDLDGLKMDDKGTYWIFDSKKKMKISIEPDFTVRMDGKTVVTYY